MISEDQVEPIEEKEDPIERVKNIVRLDANPRKSLYSGLSQSSNYGFSHTTIFSIFAYSAGISKLFPSRYEAATVLIHAREVLTP